MRENEKCLNIMPVVTAEAIKIKDPAGNTLTIPTDQHFTAPTAANTY
jgi:hypothetical protein